MRAIFFVGSIILFAAFSVWASERLNGTRAGEAILAGYMSMTLTLGFIQSAKLARDWQRP